MKLIGTTTENAIRNQLILSENKLSNDKAIYDFLKSQFGHVNSAYALAHTLDQAEDFYSVLLNGSAVIGFEIERNEENPQPKNVTILTVPEYRKELRGRLSQLALEIALDLAKKKGP